MLEFGMRMKINCDDCSLLWEMLGRERWSEMEWFILVCENEDVLKQTMEKKYKRFLYH